MNGVLTRAEWGWVKVTIWRVLWALAGLGWVGWALKADGPLESVGSTALAVWCFYDSARGHGLTG